MDTKSSSSYRSHFGGEGQDSMRDGEIDKVKDNTRL